MEASVKLGKRIINEQNPTYFIADISANHDGNLDRAVKLIHLAKESGVDGAKFQNFRAKQIVSEYGFKKLGGQVSHQSKWKQSVSEVYEAASLSWDWTATLKKECDKVGIDYFSAPYDFEAVDHLDPYVDMFKIGSGDITWPEMLRKVAEKKKPVLLATGASDIGDVQRAVDTIVAIHPEIVLMQCNTNYTASMENFRHAHLNVLLTYKTMFPGVILGLSDHTPGHATALGAVALGARVIEKHFTDDTSRTGPDHAFSMTPQTWREMVERTKELEAALGSPNKRVSGNEKETVVVQRRCLRAAAELTAGTVITRDMIDVLRPAPVDAIFPFDIDRLLGKKLRVNVEQGDHFRWGMTE